MITPEDIKARWEALPDKRGFSLDSVWSIPGGRVAYLIKFCEHHSARYVKPVTINESIALPDSITYLLLQGIADADKEFNATDCVPHHQVAS